MSPRNLDPDKNLIHRAWQKVPSFFASNDVAPGKGSGLSQAEIDQAVASVFSSGPSYYYVLDFHNVHKPMYLSPSVRSLLGLDPDNSTIQDIINCVHPDDLAFVAAAEETAIRLLHRIGMQQVRQYKISYCFRLKTADQGYRLFNHQCVILATDENDGVARALGIHTDITHLTAENNYKLSLLHLLGGESYLKVDVLNDGDPVVSQPSIFSPREMEVVRLLASGLTSAEIAAELGIAENTVKNHRKNILKRAGCKTTGQLVSRCIGEGLI